MHVFAFDRDWTVDVNPHPRHEAVPLEWVKHLAHETHHAVYAIGNQDLAEEAAIPGVVDIVGRHADNWDEWLGGKQPDGYYERFPTRRERLSLIADLHPDADEYVVVDDLDLSDIAGWAHYHAWEFVPAVERGEIHPDLPWAREPVADGGYPTSAGIIPVDAADLAEFIDEYADAPAFELRYDDESSERTYLLADISVIDRTVERPAAAPAIRCHPASPRADPFSVRVDAVEQLSTVDPPAEAFTAAAEAPTERATALRRLAEAKPDAVTVSAVLTLLDNQNEDSRQDALRALRLVADNRPEDCTPAIPILRSLLQRDDLAAPADALGTLQAIGETDPADIAPLTEEIRTYLGAADDAVRRESVRCIAAIADGDPADAVDAVPALATVIEDQADGLPYAVYTLSCVTQEFPEAVEPAAGALGDVIADATQQDSVRLNATAALGRIVGEHPDTGLDIVDDVAALFDADNRKLRNNAVGLVGDVATVHTDVVEPYTDDIGSLLTVDDTYTRINASAALARIAEDFPDEVAPLAPQFRTLLDDDHPVVRKNACWALGHLGDDTAKSTLETISETDDDEDVRTRAMWAVAQIEGAHDP
ncbi:HEAT repeat domain-containing protein [Halorientalis regularis]|uniref:HEAT repeat-containing protein n=1 Tax=Halorientalis regularis TaxID=660518 RepID=A0A1G7QBY0_9EURY|nr:HEAT repeat domain-containing protein [Halorientalis regularis]SDF96061.1 HEAT repeat-containing protein [Halorientalis regularis]